MVDKIMWRHPPGIHETYPRSSKSSTETKTKYCRLDKIAIKVTLYHLWKTSAFYFLSKINPLSMDFLSLQWEKKTHTHTDFLRSTTKGLRILLEAFHGILVLGSVGGVTGDVHFSTVNHGSSMIECKFLWIFGYSLSPHLTLNILLSPHLPKIQKIMTGELIQKNTRLLSVNPFVTKFHYLYWI